MKLLPGLAHWKEEEEEEKNYAVKKISNEKYMCECAICNDWNKMKLKKGYRKKKYFGRSNLEAIQNRSPKKEKAWNKQRKYNLKLTESQVFTHEYTYMKKKKKRRSREVEDAVTLSKCFKTRLYHLCCLYKTGKWIKLIL